MLCNVGKQLDQCIRTLIEPFLTSDTIVVSTLYKVENQTSDFVSFSTSDQVLESLFLHTLLKKARETNEERQPTVMEIGSKDSTE